jgi:oligogalacturonide lyase
MKHSVIIILLLGNLLLSVRVHAQIGKHFPSERKEINDPLTGNKLIFLTSTTIGDSKI